jgi:hypothetical protein
MPTSSMGEELRRLAAEDRNSTVPRTTRSLPSVADKVQGVTKEQASFQVGWK